MTAPGVPSDLPLLTDIVNADGTPVRIPTLTEVVPAEIVRHAESTPVAHEVHSLADMAAELVWQSPAEMPVTSAPIASERNISETEMQQLLDHFEAHLESVFTDKLNHHLQQLHHQAVKLAILDLKNELPELLRNALNPSDRKK